MVVIKLRVKFCAVFEAASVQSCRVITIDIKCVKDVRVEPVRILFLSLLKEYKDMLGVFYRRCNQPRTICIPSGAANFLVGISIRLASRNFHWSGSVLYQLNVIVGPTTQIYGQQFFELLHRFGKSFLCRLAEQFQTQVVTVAASCRKDLRRRSICSKG